MSASFRTKVFLASVAAAAVALLVVALLLSWQVREHQRETIAQRLTQEARLIADLLAAATALDSAALDAEADRLGQYIASRVTLITEDGRVVGDSTQTVSQLPTMENHLDRPEVAAARGSTAGISRRYSTTIDTDFLYAAVRTSHPVVRYVRVALPLTDIDAQLAAIRTSTLIALAAAIPAALAIAWILSGPIGRRVREASAAAARYAAGDFSQRASDFGSDELGAVARALDASAQELGRRIEEMSRDQARTDAILTGMIEGVLVIDRDGRLQLVNHAAREMLGIEGDMRGRRYLEAIRHPDIATQLAGVLHGEGAGVRELVLPREPGRTVISRAAAVAASGGGGAVLVLHDITDLRRTDQIRRDFVSNVSHELRTPLTAIRGYLEAVRDEVAGQDEAQRFLDVISRHAMKMERLVADLLRLARLDARQEPLDLVPCDLSEIFRAVVADLTPAIEQRRQRVRIDADPSCRLEADAGKLHDIIRNLVENAVNYSADAAAIRIESTCEHGTCRIAVIDSGPGIPPQDLTRVFERFYRVDRSRSRPGTGLGLAIVKHLVELHGGDVRAANAREGGAMFTVTLPERPVATVTRN